MLRNKNEDSEAIIRRNAPTVFKIAFLRTKNTHDAEDIMQEVFVRFAKRLPVFESIEHEKAWFIRTTINRTKSFFSSSWNKHTVLSDDAKAFEASDNEYELLDLVLSLPKDISTAIHLFYYNEMPIKDIAYVMKKSEASVKTLLYRGRKLLKLELTDNREENSNV